MKRLALLASALMLFACSSSDSPASPDGSTGDATGGDTTTTPDGTTPAPDGTTPDPDGTTPEPDGEVEIDCTGKADGTSCGGEGIICLKDACVPSTCGDDFVDTENGEECDDATEGCSDCKFLCKEDGDCDDKETCNGDETCDKAKHVCVAGTALADATSCGTDMVCNGGVCSPAGCGNGVKDGTEECDDANTVDGDGCDNDCTFSCNEDGDCNDADACNGTETCTKEADKQYCAAGTTLDCDDKEDCTTDTCDPLLGCVNTPIDADGDKHSCEDDCDDNNPVVFVGAPECADGLDNDCDGQKDEAPLSSGKCWVDFDGDGYAALGATTINNCICGDGYTNVDPTTNDNDDCYDSSRAVAAEVRPDQTEWFDYGYCTALVSKLTGKCTKPLKFDWNCDGVATQQLTLVANDGGCVKVALPGKKPFCMGFGWSDQQAPPPACGVEAKYTNCKLTTSGTTTTCLASEVVKKQKCQ